MFEWLEDTWNYVTSSDSGVSEFLTTAGTTVAEVAESLGDAFTQNDAQDIFRNWEITAQNAAPVAAKIATDNGPSLLDKVGDYFGKNDSLIKNVGGGIAAWQQGQSKEDAAEKLAQSRLNELREKDRIDQENNARFSASVSGLRRPGLMGSQQKLQRAGGANVFDGNGRMTRG